MYVIVKVHKFYTYSLILMNFKELTHLYKHHLGKDLEYFHPPLLIAHASPGQHSHNGVPYLISIPPWWA